jgi:hypothetical protein
VLDRELGGGGMSRGFPAVDRSLGRQVVVKVETEAPTWWRPRRPALRADRRQRQQQRQVRAGE